MAGMAALTLWQSKAMALDINLNVLKKKEREFPYMLTDDEWRAKLSDEQYKILRAEGTEPPNSSPLNKEKRAGMYHCAGCGKPVFSSETKYESGSGWPSFYAPAAKDAIGTSTDFKIILPRTEVHCAHCGGHLGHVFDDGPPQTGKRYCINGAALTFRAGE
jgi:peptide-methionine (R)-S-oxide reductase